MSTRSQLTKDLNGKWKKWKMVFTYKKDVRSVRLCFDFFLLYVMTQHQTYLHSIFTWNLNVPVNQKEMREIEDCYQTKYFCKKCKKKHVLSLKWIVWLGKKMYEYKGDMEILRVWNWLVYKFEWEIKLRHSIYVLLTGLC